MLVAIGCVGHPFGMGYRDDVDALYERSLTLQKALDAAERELEKFRAAPPPPPADLRPRYVPSAEHWISKIVNPPPPREPVSAPDETSFLAPFQRRAAVLEAAREHLDRLDDEMLVIVGTIIEELALEQPRPDLVDQLRALRDDIATAYQHRPAR